MKLISNQINPHFTLRDAIFAASQVWFLASNKQIDFSPWFGTKNYQLFNAARSALETIIDVVQPSKDKKIAIPAFICAVVAVPFVRRGYQIEWIDTDENGCIDLADFRSKSDNVSMLIVPHIFGQVIDLSPFAEICRKKNIFLIEDGAHYFQVMSEPEDMKDEKMRNEKIVETQHFSSQKKNKFLADARILSFGREKVVSCVSGGSLLWPENSPYAEKFASVQLSQPKKTWVLKHLFQPLFYALAMPWWNLGGKIIPMLAQKLKLMPKAVYAAEKQGKKVLDVCVLPYAQQSVLRYQLKKFFEQSEMRYEKMKNKKMVKNVETKDLSSHDDPPQSPLVRGKVFQAENSENKNQGDLFTTGVLYHQKNIADTWKSELKNIFPVKDIILPTSAFRVIVKTNKAKKIISELRKKNIHLREWDGVPIAPAGTDLTAFGYQKGQCPRAEFFSQNYITLPTNRHIGQKDVKKIVKIMKYTIK